MSTGSTEPISSSSVSNTQAVDTPATGAPAAASAPNASTPVASMSDLKDKAPKVYDAMMMSIGQRITNEMNDHQQRIKRINDEARRNNGG